MAKKSSYQRLLPLALSWVVAGQAGALEYVRPDTRKNDIPLPGAKRPDIGVTSPGAPASSRPLRPSPWYREHASGWFWYQSPAPLPAPDEKEAEDPRVRLQAWRERVDMALAHALLQPSEANVKRYMRLNERSLALAGEFASAWQRVLRGAPELDHRLRYPADDASLRAWRHHQVRVADAELARLAKDHGLLFFFSSDCPLCHRFAPVLRSFSHRYRFRVKAVSLDGGALPLYPRPDINRQAARRLGVTAVPALFLVRPSRQWVRPLGYGLMGVAELGRRILEVAKEKHSAPAGLTYAGQR